MAYLALLGCIVIALAGMRYFPATGWVLMFEVCLWNYIPDGLATKLIETEKLAGLHELTTFGAIAVMVTVIVAVVAILIDCYRNDVGKYDFD